MIMVMVVGSICCILLTYALQYSIIIIIIILLKIIIMCACVCFLPIHSGHQVRWTYQPGSHRRKVTQDFSSTFFLRCVP